ncbi:MAG: hypothetical protein IJZ96_04510 [Lachnospiraceae bacterium]|nr:hypothetical protein [Lachnospiraceae bacterium]
MNIFKKMNMALCVYIVGLIFLGYCRVGGVRDDLLFIIVNVLITVAVIIGMVMALVKIYTYERFERKQDCRCYIALNIYYMLMFLSLAI